MNTPAVLFHASLTCCLLSFSLNLLASNQDTRLDQLMALDLTKLGQVEIKLDDVFDVFDGLLQGGQVSIASGEKQPISQAPSVTSVITAQDIEAMGAAQLFEVLEAIPGLHVGISSLQYMPIYIFRGLHTDNNNPALVMINDFPLNLSSTRNQGSAWLSMQTFNIARIEVIRGPGSAVYGADAFSGVINIITKNKDDIDGTESGLRVGSFDTAAAWLLHGSHHQGIDIAFSLEMETSNGHDGWIQTDGQTPLDQTFGTSASFAPGPVNLHHRDLSTRIDLSQDHWRFRAGYQERRNFGTGAGLVALDPIGLTGKADRKTLDFTWHDPYITEYWDVKLQLSYYGYKRGPDGDGFFRVFPPGAFNGGLPDGMLATVQLSERNTRAEVSAFYSGFDQHLLRFAAGYHYTDINHWDAHQNAPPNRPEIFKAPGLESFERVLEDGYISVQDIWRITPQWELTTGLRYDYFKDIDDSLTPRLALVWQVHPRFTSKLLYGKAFRVPSVLELYDANPLGGQIGDSSLEPEVIDWQELALNWKPRQNLNLALNIFAYQWQDAIKLVPVPGANHSIFTNVGKQNGQGFEFETRWKTSQRSSLLFNYAYQSAENNDGEEPGLSPGQQAYLRIDWLFAPHWFLDGQIHWVADRKRSPGDPRTSVDDYSTVDLSLRRKQQNAPWNFAIGVRNLFDSNAREPSPGPTATGTINYPHDYPFAGRSYWAEIRYRF